MIKINEKQIPREAYNAAHEAFVAIGGLSPEVIAAALSAWPGADAGKDMFDSALILVLPLDNPSPKELYNND